MFNPEQDRPCLPLLLLHRSHCFSPPSLQLLYNLRSPSANVLFCLWSFSPLAFLAATPPCQLSCLFWTSRREATHRHRRVPTGKSSGCPGQGGHCRGHTGGLGREWPPGDSPEDKDRSEAGRAPGEPGEPGRVASVSGALSQETEGLQGPAKALGGRQNLPANGRGGTHGSLPSTALPQET